MSLATKGSRAAARTLRQTKVVRQSRRRASDSHGAPHDHAHGNDKSALHIENANPSGNESFGPGFYLTLTAVPIFYVAYSLAYGSKDNYVAQQYQKYKEGKKATAEAEEIHQAAMSQAIRDRAWISSYPREKTGPPLLYQEMFNAGSPWNQAAGGQTANLKDLEQYYHKAYAEAEQERVARGKDGKFASLYD